MKKNFAYNIAWQMLTLVSSVVLIPYISRVLGADGIGTYSFTYSIVYYFMLIALLGINNHGNRAIAKAREDHKKLSETFASIYFIQITVSLLMVVLYILYLILFQPDFLNIAQIQTIYIFSAMFDINWFFFGLEEFRATTIRNIIIKVLSILAIFLFVRTPNDVWIYTLIMAGSTLASQLVMWPLLLKKVKLIIPKWKEIAKHIKPCLVLFIPVIAVSLYKVMDKIMLGSMTDVQEVGYYEQAENITLMPLSIVTALGNVMMPRMSNFAGKGHEHLMKKYIEKAITFSMFLSFPICLGIIATANNFVPIFMGDGFESSIVPLQLLSVVPIFLAFVSILKVGFLIPKERDGTYVRLTLLGAVINLIINFLLIPNMKSVGACIGTVITEFVVALYQIVAVWKELPVMEYMKNVAPFLLKSLVMFAVVLAIDYFSKLSALWTIVLQVGVGVIIYALLNVKYGKEILYKITKKEGIK